MPRKPPSMPPTTRNDTVTVASTLKEAGMPHVKRKGKVAVLYSPGYGAGWYSWNTSHPECLYHPDIVKRVWEWNKTYVVPSYDDRMALQEELTPVAKALFGDDFYAGGAGQLTIRWMDPGTAFLVDDYDGSESITVYSPEHYLIVPS